MLDKVKAADSTSVWCLVFPKLGTGDPRAPIRGSPSCSQGAVSLHITQHCERLVLDSFAFQIAK